MHGARAWLLARRASRLFSSSVSVMVYWPSCATSAAAASCRSARSWSTTAASSCSSRPSSVTQKLTSVVCAAISGR